MARIVQIGKKKWVLGLSWISYEDLPSKADIEEEANRYTADWSCVRVGKEAIQVGLCSAIEGVKKTSGLNSLAAKVADSNEEPWLGIYQISEDLWWYIAVRDGHAILPDGDIIGGREEVLAARESHSGYTDWNYFEGNIDVLSDFIDSIEAKSTPVRSLKNEFPVALAITAGILTLAIGGGVALYMNHTKEEAESARLAAMEKMRQSLSMQVEKEIVQAPSPLLSLPTTESWMKSCAKYIQPLKISINGWELKSVGCDATNGLNGRVRGLGAVVAGSPPGALDATGDNLVQSGVLDGLVKGNDADSIEIGKAKLILISWAQSANFSLVITDVPPPPAPQGSDKKVVVVRPSAVVKLDTTVSPFNIDFSGLPGLRFNSVGSTEKGWHLEGVLYGR